MIDGMGEYPTDIQFIGQFNKVTSTTDGGWNLTLSLGQDEIVKIAQIGALRDILLKISITPVQDG